MSEHTINIDDLQDWLPVEGILRDVVEFEVVVFAWLDVFFGELKVKELS